MRYPVVRMGGLLEDYNRSQQEFREKNQPEGYNQPGENIIRAPYPAPQSDVTSVPYEYPYPQRPARVFKVPTAKTFTYLSSDDLVGFCDLVMSFRRAPFGSRERQDAIDAFSTILGRWPKENQQAIIDEVEANCPWPDFFNALTHPSRRGLPTQPYRSPGPPIPSTDTRSYQPPPPYVPPAAPPVPSFDRLQRPRPVSLPTPVPQPVPTTGQVPVQTPSGGRMPIPTTSLIPQQPAGPVPTQMTPAPVQTPGGSWGQVAQPSNAGWNQAPPEVATPGAGQCPSGQFWDGRQCRGAVSMPGGLNIPGGLPAGGGGVAFPTMGYYRVENV